MGEEDVELAATFTEIPVILSTLTWAAPENGTIAVTVAGETVESGAEVEAGTEVVATFTPAEGYELETVTLGGEDVTTDDMNSRQSHSAAKMSLLMSSMAS